MLHTCGVLYRYLLAAGQNHEHFDLKDCRVAAICDIMADYDIVLFQEVAHSLAPAHCAALGACPMLRVLCVCVCARATEPTRALLRANYRTSNVPIRIVASK